MVEDNITPNNNPLSKGDLNSKNKNKMV